MDKDQILQMEIDMIEETLSYLVTDFLLKSENRYTIDSLEEYRTYFKEVNQKMTFVYELITSEGCLCKQDKKVIEKFYILSLLFEAQVSLKKKPCFKLDQFFSTFGKKLDYFLHIFQETYNNCIIQALEDS